MTVLPLLALFLSAGPPASPALPQDSFEDPAPPAVRALEPVEAPAPRPHDDLTRHGSPKPLRADAVVEDWPGFLGPRRDGRSRETRLAVDWPDGSPTLVWEVARGSGFASPAIVGERLVFTHREGARSHVDCLHAETGERFWRHSFATDYEPRYPTLAGDGPSATPAIAGENVYVYGVQGELFCLELATGRVVWERDLNAEFGLGEGFFGAVTSPLAFGDLLILNVGVPARSVVAFDRRTGAIVWATGEKWGASCASPVVGTVGGRERLFVVTGGESRPPTGGLMVLDPRTGALEYEFPMRSRTYESVNGASPVLGPDAVYLTAAYGVGTRGLELGEGGFEPAWHSRGVGIEFSTPILHEGHLYAVDGRSDRAGAIVCLDAGSGKEVARTDLFWEERTVYRGAPRVVDISIGAGSLLHVDGRFLCLGDNGHLAWLDATPDGAKVLAKAWLFGANQTWTPPVVCRGLLYVCQNRPERFGEARRPPRLLCYDLRAAAD